MKPILAPISPGELLDKLTILRLKAERIREPTPLGNVQRELALLEATWREALPPACDLREEEAALARVNEALWEIEDAIRACEAAQRFDAEFVALARSVYQRNDERAALKRRVNAKLGSTLVEEKSYSARGGT
ncbi:MAG TPA: DUF6165 family protein [Myxococcota bacterium]|nr:DUF6165 family protein [Myxococcota bacterium]